MDAPVWVVITNWTDEVIGVYTGPEDPTALIDRLEEKLAGTGGKTLASSASLSAALEEHGYRKIPFKAIRAACSWDR
jgi:hypothetical protein